MVAGALTSPPLERDTDVRRCGGGRVPRAVESGVVHSNKSQPGGAKRNVGGTCARLYL